MGTRSKLNAHVSEGLAGESRAREPWHNGHVSFFFYMTPAQASMQARKNSSKLSHKIQRDESIYLILNHHGVGKRMRADGASFSVAARCPQPGFRLGHH